MQPKTIPALLYERCLKNPDGVAHYSLDSEGKWQPHSWKEYYSDVSHLAKGLKDLGLTFGQNIGIMAPASRQWDVVQMAILFCGGAVVGLDPHDASENINNIVCRTDLSGLIVGDVSLLEKINDKSVRKLEFIINITGKAADYNHAENVFQLDGVLKSDESDTGFHFEVIEENSPATIIFTSGTTGTPKGIHYTHGQVVTACKSIINTFEDINEKSNLVCWLPLSNLYQRIINYCAIVVGAVTYYVENPRNVLQHMQEINPHIFLGVPRFYEKLHGGILENIQQRGTLTKIAAGWAMRVGTEYSRYSRAKKRIDYYLKIKYRLADFLILGKIRNLMGNNLKFMISGSAPISEWLLEQFHSIGFLILEAYGISENIIPIAVNRPDSFKFGTVGKPLPGNEIKLADDGELLVKGPGVFSGYYNDDETKSPLTKDRYLSTGDYATFASEGFLVLTGRKSEIFKTSTGRRISPVKIETLISHLPYVEHTVVFGAGRPFLVALLSLNLQRLRERAKFERLVWDDETKNIPKEWHKIMQNDILREVADLQNYLQPAGILLTVEPFTIESGELTANLKIRRKVIAEKFEKAIASLYAEISQYQQTITDSSGRTKELVIHCQ